jgi:selenocysteine lyase/cysteine desulfurase
MNFDAARLLEVPAGGPYLLTHSVGCLPASAREALLSGYIHPWSQGGGDAWPSWLEAIGHFREALAALFGGQSREYCPQSNVSSALTKVLPALPRSDPKRNVLLAAEDAFPSLGYVLKLSERLGFEVKLIPKVLDPGIASTWEPLLDERVFAALLTHVHSNTGLATRVEEITRLCSSRGIYSVVDVAQSAGILPVRVDKFASDIIIGSCVKWLCGGPGAGFLWVRPSLLEALEPVDVGWFSHENPFEMDIRNFRFAPDARRFWGGTPSIAPFVLATEGLRLVKNLSVESILEHNRILARAFLEQLPQSMHPRAALERAGGTLCLALGEQFEATVRALKDLGARFDTRGQVIRMSFHVCNSLDDAVSVAQMWPRARSGK